MNEAPTGWRKGRFEDFAVLQRGFDITQAASTPGSVPVVSSSGVSYTHNEAKVQPPGVVTGRKGKLGKVFYLTEPFWPHDTTLWVKDFKGNYPPFVSLFIGFMNLERLDAATSVPTLNRNNVHTIQIMYPPLPEQRKIAAILGTWDAAISTMERLITALQKRKRGLMQRVLTGQVRFPEFVRPNGTQDTKYGSIPADWSYWAIGDIAAEVSSKNGVKKSLPVLSCTKYDGLVDSLEYFGRQIFSEDISNYKVVKRGQFAYATNHIEEGSIGYQDVYDEAVVSPMYTVFETKTRVNDAYLYRMLKTELYRHIFESNTSGSVNRRGGLRWSDFAKIKVPLPSLDEQCKIVEVLDAADSEIKTSMKLREQLIAQKRGLMQRLLTGQVRVRVDEEEG